MRGSKDNDSGENGDAGDDKEGGEDMDLGGDEATTSTDSTSSRWKRKKVIGETPTMQFNSCWFWWAW